MRANDWLTGCFCLLVQHKPVLGISPSLLCESRIESLAAVWAEQVLGSAQTLSRVLLFATPWTVVRQAPLSIEFFWQEHCSGLPCPPPGDLTNPEIEPVSHLLHRQADSLPLVPPGKHVSTEKELTEKGLKKKRVPPPEMPLWS